MPWKARSARPVGEHVNARLALEAPLVAPTLKDDKLTAVAEQLAAAAAAPTASSTAAATTEPAAS